MKSKVIDLPLLGDRYTISNDEDGLKLINSSGEKVDVSPVEIGNEIGDEVLKNKSLYYKLIPLSSFPDIITFKLIDSVLSIGGFADDLLEASCKKGENYCRYAISKIKEAEIPLIRLSDQVLKEISRLDGTVLLLYDRVTEILNINPDMAFEKITSKEVLSLDDLIALDKLGKLQEISREIIIHPDQDFPSRFIVLLNSLAIKDQRVAELLGKLPMVRISECSFRTPEATDLLRNYQDFNEILKEKDILFLTDVNRGITSKGNEIDVDLTNFLEKHKIIIIKQTKLTH